MPEMRRVTIRFGLTLWNLIDEEAERDGSSSAQFIREAALTAVIARRTQRGDEHWTRAERVARELRHELDPPTPT